MSSTFAQFCAALGVKLTPAQSVVAGVAFDRRPLSSGEYALADSLFGSHDLVIPEEARTVVDAMCGGRGGKSYIFEALRLLHLALTVPLTSLAPGEIAVGLIVAPDMRLARQTLRYVAGAVAHPALADVVESISAERILLRRPDGRVALEALPATAGGSAVRARSLVGASMDEAAFFFDAGHVVNDVHLFEAVRPRILPGGQVIIASTPWLQSGLLYKLHRDNWGKPKTAVAVYAPTVLLRPCMAKIVEEERLRDPDNARREFDAIPLPTGAGVFFDPAALRMSLSDEVFISQPGDELIAAADFGFRVNASALVCAIRRGEKTHLIRVVEMRPEPGRPLVPSCVVDAFAEYLREFGARTVIADGHYRESIVEHLTRHGISMEDAPSGAEGKAQTHLAARAALNERRVTMPNNIRLVKQLSEIVATPVSGGSLSIRSPQWSTGEHGDLASSAVLAISARGGQLVERRVDLSDAHTRIKEDVAAYWDAERRDVAQRKQDEDSGLDDDWETRFVRIA
jgi:hypothetical protein